MGRSLDVPEQGRGKHGQLAPDHDSVCAMAVTLFG